MPNYFSNFFQRFGKKEQQPQKKEQQPQTSPNDNIRGNVGDDDRYELDYLKYQMEHMKEPDPNKRIDGFHDADGNPIIENIHGEENKKNFEEREYIRKFMDDDEMRKRNPHFYSNGKLDVDKVYQSYEKNRYNKGGRSRARKSIKRRRRRGRKSRRSK